MLFASRHFEATTLVLCSRDRIGPLPVIGADLFNPFVAGSGKDEREWAPIQTPSLCEAPERR